jgi:Cu(I)/Ag(I) efflux system membrane protein CusA/SilA
VVAQTSLDNSLYRVRTFVGALVLATGIGREFMPPLNEGDVMYMPVTDPAISIDEALKIMGKQDATLKSFAEVESAVGKAGRAETSTDPAPVNMNETIVHLKPQSEWRAGVTRESLIAEMDETAYARCDEHLDAADHQSHRYALDRPTLAGRH